MYSCGIFERPEATLEEAATAKVERICRKLDLRAKTIWSKSAPAGAGLRFTRRRTTDAASRPRRFRARSTITRSSNRGRGAVGANHRAVRGLPRLSGQFDKLVSIEMIEAVGHQFLDHIFANAASC